MDGAEDHELLEAGSGGGGDDGVGLGLGGGGFVGFIGVRPRGGFAEGEAAHELAELLGCWTEGAFVGGVFGIIFGFGGVWCGNGGDIGCVGLDGLLPAWWRWRVEEDDSHVAE